MKAKRIRKIPNKMKKKLKRKIKILSIEYRVVKETGYEKKKQYK